MISDAPRVTRRSGRLTRAAVVCLALALLGTAATRAAANDGPDRKASVDELSPERRKTFLEFLKAGNEAYRNGNYEKALPFYEKAHDIAAKPLIHYRMAICYERSDQPKRALEQYRRFLERKPNAKKRGKVETTIEKLEQKLQSDSRATVRLQSSPPGARAYLDGPVDDESGDRADGETPMTVDVDPGTLQIRLRKKGYRPVRREVEVNAGETYDVTYLMKPDRGYGTVPPRPSSSKTIAIVATIIGGAGALVGGTLYVISLNCSLNRKSAGCSRDLFNATAYGAYIGGGLGVLGLGTGAVVGLLQPARFPSRGSERALRLELGPTSIGLSGRF